ncbi:MAG: hypothetical protein FWD11_08715 [Micrococcales bacterium]|nr:hypothetical protein [Micrococcales bacterium]
MTDKHPDHDEWVPDDLDAVVVPDDLSGLVVPDDLSGLDELGGTDDQPDPPDLGTEPTVPDVDLDEPVTIAVLLTQVVEAEPLAAVCALAGVQADAVASPAGSLAILADPTTGATAAANVSRVLAGTHVVLVERRDGSIEAGVWSRGARGEEVVAPGLLLAEGPAVLEDLLLGDTTASDLEGAVPSAGISRFKALRLLSKAARHGRNR